MLLTCSRRTVHACVCSAFRFFTRDNFFRQPAMNTRTSRARNATTDHIAQAEPNPSQTPAPTRPAKPSNKRQPHGVSRRIIGNRSDINSCCITVWDSTGTNPVGIGCCQSTFIQYLGGQHLNNNTPVNTEVVCLDWLPYECPSRTHQNCCRETVVDTRESEAIESRIEEVALHISLCGTTEKKIASKLLADTSDAEAFWLFSRQYIATRNSPFVRSRFYRQMGTTRLSTFYGYVQAYALLDNRPDNWDPETMLGITRCLYEKYGDAKAWRMLYRIIVSAFVIKKKRGEIPKGSEFPLGCWWRRLLG